MTKAELEQLRETWRARVADFYASGKSGAAWCAANQVKEHQLWYWVGKFKSESTEAPKTRFVPICTDAATAHPQPLLVRIGQVEIEVRFGHDPNLLRDVVRTLSSLC